MKILGFMDLCARIEGPWNFWMGRRCNFNFAFMAGQISMAPIVRLSKLIESCRLR